jgi:hypothetical protein
MNGYTWLGGTYKVNNHARDATSVRRRGTEYCPQAHDD